MKPFRKIAFASVLPTFVVGEIVRETEHEHEHEHVHVHVHDETFRALLVAYLASARGAMFAVRETERGAS